MPLLPWCQEKKMSNTISFSVQELFCFLVAQYLSLFWQLLKYEQEKTPAYFKKMDSYWKQTAIASPGQIREQIMQLRTQYS